MALKAGAAYAMSKTYTDESLSGAVGVLAGKNCTIQSVVKTGGVSVVTFAWEEDDGTARTSVMTVSDGATGKQGEPGEGFKISDKYDSTEEMVADAENVPENTIVMVVIDDTGYLYIRDTEYTGATTGFRPIGSLSSINAIKGDKGDTGEDGKAATVTVGTVTSGNVPSVTNVGTSTDAIFNFVLQKGDKGDKGDTGANGVDGKDGKDGAKGEKGDTGASGGVTTPLQGFFTMAVDENGNLYAYSETDMSDAFEYDSTTGNLYYITNTDTDTEVE